jgi:hypothetical protein
MTKRVALFGAWTAALLAIGCALVCAGRGPLALPSRASAAAVRTWASSRDPATVMMSVLRLVALLLDGYMLLTTLVGAAVRGARWATGVRALDVLTPVVVRRVLALSLGAVLLSAPLLADVTPAFAGPVTIVLAPAVNGPPLVRVGSNGGAAVGVPRGGQARGTAPPARPPSTTPPSSTTDAPAAPTSAPTSAPTRAAPTLVTATDTGHPEPGAPQPWVVARGDTFWDVARRVLELREGKRVNASQIAPFWLALIRANRDRIRSGNPSLIYAGERFVIPSA